MKRNLLIVIAIVALTILLQAQEQGKLTIWAEPNYSSWENPLHTELSVNGQILDIFTAETDMAIPLKSGWNTVTLKTTPQPTDKENDLIFRIGPMEAAKGKKVMEPVLWRFRNGTDWKLRDSQWSHPLGPNVKDVTLSYKLYFAGLDLENQEIKAGDYILQGRPNYESWNSPVVATVWVNGTPLNSFLLQQRHVVITKMLKPGKNEIKIVSGRVKDSIAGNDILFDVLGPAEWNVSENKFTFTPILKFTAMQGWTKDPKSGQLVNRAKPTAEEIERVVPFMMKTAAAAPSGD